MKFKLKINAEGATVSIGGKDLDPKRLAGIEMRVVANQLPQVVLTLIPDEVEVDLGKAAVTQVETDAPAKPTPPPAPNREQRRAAGKKGGGK